MTQKQFNIEEARLISEGKKLGKIKTRDGFEVTILHWDVRNSHPIAGIVHLGDDCDYVRQWTNEGKADCRSFVTTSVDLVLEVEGGEA